MAAKRKAKRPAARKPAKKAPARKASKSTMRASRAHESGGSYLKYSGKFTVRLPRSLHQALVSRAEREGVSLNLFVTNALSRTVK